jgi:hypothetical protein
MFEPVPCRVRAWSADESDTGQAAIFYGLLDGEHGVEAVIRIAGAALLSTIHPSRVTLDR